jgi:hypothetical protein
LKDSEFEDKNQARDDEIAKGELSSCGTRNVLAKVGSKASMGKQMTSGITLTLMHAP